MAFLKSLNDVIVLILSESEFQIFAAWYWMHSSAICAFIFHDSVHGLTGILSVDVRWKAKSTHRVEQAVHPFAASGDFPASFVSWTFTFSSCISSRRQLIVLSCHSNPLSLDFAIIPAVSSLVLIGSF